MNVGFMSVAAALIWLHKRHRREARGGMDREMDGEIGVKRIIASLCLAVWLVGVVVFLLAGR